MAVKSERAQDDSTGAITGKIRKHIISRLQKAAAYSEELVLVLRQKSTVGVLDSDYLEAQAYALSLSGAVEFEKQFNKRFEDSKAQKSAWSPCLTNFSEAHVIYSALLHATQKDIYKEVLGGTVDPSIRYAAYQSRLPRTVAIATVAKQYFRQDQPFLPDIQRLDPNALSERKASVTSISGDGTSSADIPTEITWRGRTAQIADAAIGSAVASATLAADQLNSSLSSFASTKALAAAFDPVLTAAQDVADAVRRSLSELSKEGVPESDARVQDLRVCDLAANYNLISWRVGRNRVLISSSPTELDDGLTYSAPSFTPRVPRSRKARANSKSNAESPADTPNKGNSLSRGQRLAAIRDRAVLYSSTIQSLDAIVALPGASRDASFVAEIEAQKAYFHSLRCLNLAYAHQIMGGDGEREALALFARAAQIAASAAPNADIDASGSPTLHLSKGQVEALQSHAKLVTARQQGLVVLRELSDQAAGEDANPPPLIANMVSYPTKAVDLKNLVPIPPRLEPVPVKPIFLDVAYNYITYPGQARYEPTSAEGDVEVDASENQASDGGKRKSGWFGGLLGR